VDTNEIWHLIVAVRCGETSVSTLAASNENEALASGDDARRIPEKYRGPSLTSVLMMR